MDEVTEQHLARLRTATITKLDHSQLSRWVERNTYLNGKPYSFVGHEYQRRIMDDPSPHKVIRKCSQVGISETALRMSSALMGVMQNFTLIYVLPTSSFAGMYGKTRLDPIVMSSPALRSAVDTDSLANQDVKQFGSNYLWLRGSNSTNSPISIAADCLVIDEKSFCDQEILSQFHSRITHSKYRWKFELSTPTWPLDPIDLSFQQSRRHWNMVKCNHCAHSFAPDFYNNVVVPDWNKHLDEITKENLHLTRFKEAYVACPRCGKSPDLGIANREWVVENGTENWEATGFQVQPFDAPTIISVPYLIQSSTAYDSKSRFRQYNLGLPSADSESGLTEEDLNLIGVESAGGFSSHVLGVDLGLTCHMVVAGVAPDQTLVVVHYERVPLSQFRLRYGQICSEYRVSIKVSDLQPYSDLILSLSGSDSNLFGATYVTRQGMEVYSVKDREADPQAALAGVRQVSISRNQLFDKVLADVRDRKIKVKINSEWGLFKSHLLSMKRASATLRNGEFTSTWVKSADGRDHFHHALGYAHVAAQMRGIATGFSGGMMGVSKFSLKQPEKRSGPTGRGFLG